MSERRSLSQYPDSDLRILNCKTAIIGAGMSGCTAAYNLLQNNYEDVYLVEADERIGGRMHTIEFSKSCLVVLTQTLNIFESVFV
jgi:monoamine oxidase